MIRPAVLAGAAAAARVVVASYGEALAAGDAAPLDELRASSCLDPRLHEHLATELRRGERAGPSAINEMTKTLWNHCLELTWNHGTESDPDFKVHDGNAQPQGFGHTGFLVDEIEKACEAMETAGVQMKKRPSDGNMRGLAFAYDPDGYWVELIDRSASFSGVASNY